MKKIKTLLKNKFLQFKILFEQAVEKGMLLVAATVAAIYMANSKGLVLYESFIHFSVNEISIHSFVNEFLMSIFFLLVGAEIKRELIEGHLSSWNQRLLPMIAAISGVICPVIIYTIFNYNDSLNMQGWAIPAATDIAFAIAILSLCGNFVPYSLKVFLVALAIIDDLIAVIIIAIFYTETIDFMSLIASFGLIFVIYKLNKKFNIFVFFIIGAILWLLFLKSGIHSTIAGVILGGLLPMTDGKKRNQNTTNQLSHYPLKFVEVKISKLVSYVILPLFAFTNSGLRFVDIDFSSIFNNQIIIGIAAALFFGKQFGIFATIFLMLKMKFIEMPQKANLLQFYGVSILCGIGFTMSLFIGVLAFNENESATMSYVQAGVLSGSLISAIYGAIILQASKLLNKPTGK